MNEELQFYLEHDIRDKYKKFDHGHDERHFDEVYNFTKKYAPKLFPDTSDLLLIAAAYHDTGLTFGRDDHEKNSVYVFNTDIMISKYIATEDENDLIRGVILHHRKSKFKDIDLSLEERFLRVADSASGLSKDRSLYRVVAFNFDNYGTEGIDFIKSRVKSQLKRKPIGFHFMKSLPDLETYGLKEKSYRVTDENIEHMIWRVMHGDM